MTLDPQEVVEGVVRRAHDPSDAGPPQLLEHSAEPPPPLQPVRQTDEVQALHHHWAQIHAGHASEAADGTAMSVAGVRARVRARVATVAAEIGRTDQQDDRALIGALIRAVDTLAARADQLADRLAVVEQLVPDLVGTLGEDLVRLRAALESTHFGPSSPPAANGQPSDRATDG